VLASASHRISALIGGITALVAVLLLTIGWIGYHQARPDAEPQTQAKRAPNDRAGDGKPSGRQYETAYDKRMVTDRVSWNYLGKKTIDIALINPTKDADLAKTTRECLRRNLPGHEFAQCYVFDSKREYEFKNLTAQLDLPADTPKTGLAILCYEYIGRQERGKPAHIVDFRDAPQTWKQQGCPGW
jgi:hypothetical protein